jgi:hypothetical protein
MAPVKGKVTASGNPVTGGKIVFSPVTSGDQELPNSTGEVQPDGSFELPDGAVVGEHRVTVVIDGKMADTGNEDNEEADESEAIGAVVNSWTTEATVQPGDNDLAIDLTPNQTSGRRRAQAAYMEEEDDD